MPAPGVVLADRFVLGSLLGAGAMGQVFEAFDRVTNAAVAVKVMLQVDPSAASAARFASEIEALAELSHPGIVGYVGHGATDDGRPFLAMELLAGEDLEAKLARGPLGLDASLSIVERVASALALAHGRGIVHRDIKPSNLFLRGGAIEGVTVLDFGIARRAGAGPALTRTGAIVGTPEYMAPEQARGRRDLGPAVDVFALGGVLYHCLTGRPPFTAEHVMATLAKILFEEPIPLHRIRPDVPPSVVALLAHMLEKAPEARLSDGGAVLEALLALRAEVGTSERGYALPPVGLGGGELELVTVLLVARPARLESDDTMDARSLEPETGEAPSTTELGAPAVLDALSARGAPAQRLADGSIVAPFGGGSAVDQAFEATRCARLARERWPDARVAVATARRVAGTSLPVGEALDRAAALISAVSTGDGDVLLDDVTAGLVDGRVRTASVGSGGTTLQDDAPRSDPARLLLGKPTPCVGREQEVAMLEMTMASSFDEGASRAVLVVAPPGQGKSRLRHELITRLRQRDAGERPLIRLEARGEALRAGSPYALVAHALRSALARSGPGARETSADLAAAVRRFVAPAAATDVAEIVGEICDLPFSDDESVRLRAARQDSRLMQARIVEAFVTLLRGMCALADVVVILEDVHWADRASLDLVGLALRELEDGPLFVVAFARPEIGEVAPELWKGRVVELPLRPLGRRACERLVQRIAGDRLAPATIAKIVDRSDGNALYLEELLRAACEGNADAPPATVLAMLQARIGHLAPAERRTLRAASVFGESFELEGVRAVLGPAVDPLSVGPWLEALSRAEIVESQRADEGAYRFRHALMRDAAYGLLVEEDRRVGHRLAATYLAGRAHDAALIAEHFQRSDAPREAAPWFLKAAQRAQDRDDYVASERLARRGREVDAQGELRGALGALEAWSAIMRWDWSAAASALAEASPHVRAGTTYWCFTQRTASQLAAYRNDLPTLRACGESYLAAEPDEDARIVYCNAAVHLASSAIQVGLVDLGRRLLRRADDTIGDEIRDHAALEAWRDVIRCTLHRHTDDDLGQQLPLLARALASYEAAGVTGLMPVLTQDILAEVECRAGLVDEGQARARRSHDAALASGTGLLLAHARLALANALLAGQTPDEHEEAARLAEVILATRGVSAGYQAMARDVLAASWLSRGDAAAARDAAREAIVLSPHTPVRRWLMVARLTDALVALGQVAEARSVAAQALEEIAASGEPGGYAELPLVLAAARSAEAAGDTEAARALWRRACTWCRRQAASFAADELRDRYLRSVAHVLDHEAS